MNFQNYSGSEGNDKANFVTVYYHEEDEINEYEVTFFVKEGELFRRFEETHYQRGYTAHQMKEFLAKAGLEFVTMADSDTDGEVTPESERIYMIARECGK